MAMQKTAVGTPNQVRSISAKRGLKMNEDIIKGKWQEIKGRVKEKWGKLTDNGHVEIEGKGEKLLGLLRKRYGYVRDKAEPEYKDTVELVEIIGRIREIMAKKKDFMPIAYIVRYGQPLLAKRQEGQRNEKKGKYGDNTNRNFDTRPRRRAPHLAS
jgi:uncharacterized protein YjbJ (UPF0337 family)